MPFLDLYDSRSKHGCNCRRKSRKDFLAVSRLLSERKGASISLVTRPQEYLHHCKPVLEDYTEVIYHLQFAHFSTQHSVHSQGLVPPLLLEAPKRAVKLYVRRPSPNKSDHVSQQFSMLSFLAPPMISGERRTWA